MPFIDFMISFLVALFLVLVVVVALIFLRAGSIFKTPKELEDEDEEQVVFLREYHKSKRKNKRKSKE